MSKKDLKDRIVRIMNLTTEEGSNAWEASFTVKCRVNDDLLNEFPKVGAFTLIKKINYVFTDAIDLMMRQINDASDM